MSTIMYFFYIVIGLLIVPYQVLCGGMVRFRDGYSSADGRVEVKANEDGEWGNICSDEFDIIDADVICRQMDYAWALYVYDVSDTLGDRDVVLWDLDCEGPEENVYECEHDQEPPSSGCSGVGGVGVECIAIDKSEFDSYKELRLVGENDDIQGNLQIYDGGDWRPICSNGFDIEDAVVACRQLGFISAVEFDTYYSDSKSGIYMNFECNYNQGYLLACEHTKGECSEFISIECAGEFEDYLGTSYNFPEYYEWQYYNPCDELDCHNGGHCYILYDYLEAFCDCPPEWEGEQCQDPVNPGGNSGGNNGGPATTDAPAQNTSDDVIIFIAIGAGAFVLLVAVIVTISVAMIMRRRNKRRAKARAPVVELDLKGKPIVDNRRNNNSYQGLARPGKPANLQPKSKPTSAPSSDYYLEPSPDYISRQQPVDDYTALSSPGSELYDEIPYDSIDNGGYMDLKNPSSPSDYQPPPALPKPR